MNNWADKLGFKRPNNKIEWAMWIGTSFILLAIIYSLLFVKKPIELPLHALTGIGIVSVLKDIGFGIIASALLIDGFLRIKNDKKKTKGYFSTIVSIGWFIYLIGSPAIVSVMLSNIQTDVIKSSNLLIDKETHLLVKKDLSNTDKSRLTKKIAEERFFKDGFIAEYIDEKGSTLKYQPTAENVQNREQFLFSQRLISILRYEMVFWIIALAINVASYVLYCGKRTRSD